MQVQFEDIKVVDDFLETECRNNLDVLPYLKMALGKHAKPLAPRSAISIISQHIWSHSDDFTKDEKDKLQSLRFSDSLDLNTLEHVFKEFFNTPERLEKLNENPNISLSGCFKLDDGEARFGGYEDIVIRIKPEKISYVPDVKCVVDYLEKAVERQADWLSDLNDDGIPKKLSGGYQKLARQASRQAKQDRAKKEKARQNRQEKITAEIEKRQAEGSFIREFNITNGIGANDSEMIKVLSYLTHYEIDDDIITDARVERDYTGAIDVRFSSQNDKGLYTNFAIRTHEKEMGFAGWGSPTAGHKTAITKQFFANRIALCTYFGVERMRSMFGYVGSYAFARYGFVPDKSSWQGVKEEAQERYETIKHKIPEDDRDIIEQALKSDNPKAIWQLADRKFKIKTRSPVSERTERIPIGLALLGNNGWSGTFEMKDKEVLARAKKYIDQKKPRFDRAMERAQYAKENHPWSKVAGINPVSEMVLRGKKKISREIDKARWTYYRLTDRRR